uniref:Haloacid dehalogenase-like hydrolase domain-containing protein 2 n=1 Tax=Oryctolagus cuniculus TaxID=9986 RepID=A0A5F9DRA4_RABIT
MAARRALKAVLVDLNGTLHIEDAAVPGAQEALKRLRGTSVMVRFVTNTTKESKQDLLERLRKLEFEISEDEIFTSLTAARSLVEQKQVRPMLLVDDRALPDFKGIQTNDPNAVVIGLAPEHFHYQVLNQAFRLLLDGAPLIAIHKARYYKRKDGLALGPGPFVTALEYATDTPATVVGKPETTFFLEALRSTGCSPEEAVMIGDGNTERQTRRKSALLPTSLARASRRPWITSCSTCCEPLWQRNREQLETRSGWVPHRSAPGSLRADRVLPLFSCALIRKKGIELQPATKPR